MIAFRTRDRARTVQRNVNSRAPAKLKPPVKDTDGIWIFPGLSHTDNKGTLTLRKA